jgi:RNA polymerase sigma-70 factor (ECF subfamily)
LFDRYGREVFAYCRRRTDPDAASDCAAETFLVAWRRFDDVPDGDAGLGWLYGVARRVLANEHRRTRRRRRLVGRLRRVDPVPVPTPEVVVVRRDRDRAMLTALAELRPQDQELLRLAVWEELSHAEIADLVGCSTQAASQRISRALGRLGKTFERLDHGHTVGEAPRQMRGGEPG